jgi:hypothetical protein
VITPPSLVAVLQQDWHGDVPFVHPSAAGLLSAPRTRRGAATGSA